MKRTIYDNYDLWETYSDDYLKETALECGWVDSEEDITDEKLIDWRYEEDSLEWECVKANLYNHFNGKTVIFFGMFGDWQGNHRGGKVGTFIDLLYKAIEQCDYVRIYDDNGHLYLECSHHDGSNYIEIKELTEKGENYYYNWEYSFDKRTEEYVHNQIIKRYSRLPRYMES